MKKIILTSFVLSTLAACSSSFQTNKTQNQTILRSKFNQDLPKWVIENSGKLTEEGNKVYYVAEIVRPGSKNLNTVQLERAAQLAASAQLATRAAQRLNSSIALSKNDEDIEEGSTSFNAIGETSVKISSISPDGSYWQLIEYADGGREYRVYARVGVDKKELEKAMTTAFTEANPSADKTTVDSVLSNVNLNDNKIF